MDPCTLVAVGFGVYLLSKVRFTLNPPDLHCDECGIPLDSTTAKKMKPLWIRFAKNYEKQSKGALRHESEYLCVNCYRDYDHDEKNSPESFYE